VVESKSIIADCRAASPSHKEHTAYALATYREPCYGAILDTIPAATGQGGGQVGVPDRCSRGRERHSASDP